MTLVWSIGGNTYWANLIWGAVIMFGVIRFSLRQPLPWLAILVAVPYLLVVVALVDKNLRWFVIWVLIGAAFHKSAVLMIPLAALASGGNRLWTVFWVSLMALLGGYLFLFNSVDALWENYVEADYQFSGGLIRVLMNLVPALLFLSLNKRMQLTSAEQRLWWCSPYG